MRCDRGEECPSNGAASEEAGAERGGEGDGDEGVDDGEGP